MRTLLSESHFKWANKAPLNPLSLPPSQSEYEISNYATEQVVFLKAVALRSIAKERPGYICTKAKISGDTHAAHKNAHLFPLISCVNQ